MTTDLEKQFFDTFGIEPKYEDACRLADEYWQDEELANEYGTFDYFMEFSGCSEKVSGCIDECRHAYSKTIHPQVTDRILLELICIWNLYCTHTLIPTDYQKIKEYVLEQFANINTYKFIVDTPIVKHQVRTLFEEG